MKKIIPLLLLLVVTKIVVAQPPVTVPHGLRLLAPCHYSYGCAAASDGTVWFTEFNHRMLRQVNKNGTVVVRQLGIPGMYGLTIDASNNVFVGLDLGDIGNPGKIMKITSGGTQSDIVTGITRPRQLTVDATGNVYFATESPSQISKWNKANGLVTVLASGLTSPAQGVAVASDGTVYFSQYGAPESGVYGHVKKISTGGTISTVATNFWRGRGLVINSSNDYLYLCTESDQADHGNSGLLIKIKISDGSTTNALQGLDYPQFPSMGTDGRVFFTMTRDSWLGVYDPSATTVDASWATDTTLETGLSSGTWSASGMGGALNLNLNNQVTMNGKVHATLSGGTVYGWIRIPASKFSLNLNELYTNRCDTEHPAPGIFQLPSITYESDSGSCLISALAVRGHVGQRWPMSNPGSCTESPAPGFSESPVAYLVYFSWNNTDRVTTILSPSYNENGQKLSIVKGSETGWTYFGNPWPASSQSWLNAGKNNSPPSAASWTELDLGSFSGKSKYVYVMWHKNGIYRPNAAIYRFYDYTLDKQVSNINETLHADGLNHSNDTFSGWYQLGKTKINLTPSTRLRISQDTPVTSTEYLQSDAVMLTDYPLVDNTSLGAAENFESMPVLSVSSAGPVGVGNHWAMQGLGQQFTVTSGKSWTARIDSNVVTDVPLGNYYVEVSWTYFNTDNTNATNARYYVNGTLLSDVINQNRSATNQTGSFVQGNSVGTWSGFYRLSGTYYYNKNSSPLSVNIIYDSTLYGGKRLVADMVRFVPVSP